MKNLFVLPLALLVFIGCNNQNTSEPSSSTTTTTTTTDTSTSGKNGEPTQNKEIADAATIMARKQVPILCYHHIREISMPSKSSMGYEVTVAQFKQQMKILADSGYKTILPNELYDYLAFGKALPEKPVMITYDDSSEEHFSIAKHEMDKYGFKGVFFLMTIAIGKPRYMSKEQIKQLADEGHAIESHTWDHHRVDRYKNENTVEIRGVKKVVNDWDIQLAGTKTSIQEISDKPVEHFAYPFGIWSKEGIPEIRERGYKLAYQLSTPRDSTEPLYTVRRMIVSPSWSPQGMLKVMRSTFK